MAVTDIVLAKFYRFCQLLSHSRRFFARVRYRFLNIGSSPCKFLGGRGRGLRLLADARKAEFIENRTEHLR
jgi:hypothetical protein